MCHHFDKALSRNKSCDRLAQSMVDEERPTKQINVLLVENCKFQFTKTQRNICMYKEKFKIFGVANKEQVVMCNDLNSIEHIFVDHYSSLS